MRILGIDTATRATSVALWEPGGQALEGRDDPAPGAPPGHATHLMPLVAWLMERSGVRWEDIDRIAVGVGPGSFTGLRIGIATAKALAHARAIHIVPVSTLRSLAWNVRSRREAGEAEAAVAVLDARRGEVFAAAWQLAAVESGTASDAPPLLGPDASRPEALAELLRDRAPASLAVGDGAIRFRPVLARSGTFIPSDDSELHRVTAINHCRLARDLPASSPDEIRPEYLRPPDAEIARGA